MQLWISEKSIHFLDCRKGIRWKSMKNNENNPVDYTIVSKPAFVNFICPHCFNDVEVPFSEVDFKTEYWGDGAYCNCPLCDKEVELRDFDYD